MPKEKRKGIGNGKSNGATLGFEATLWAAADKLRGHMDAAEYKHVVLGLIFLKYISDAFEERYGFLLSQSANPKSDWYVREEKARYKVGAKHPLVNRRNDPTARTDASPLQRDRRGKTLFIDARKLGVLIDRVHRDLADEDIARIADTYHAWRGANGRGGLHGRPYEDVPGFCKSATLDDIRGHGYVLTPGRYVGAADVEDDDEPFEEKMKRLTAILEDQFAESTKLEKAIRANLRRLNRQ